MKRSGLQSVLHGHAGVSGSECADILPSLSPIAGSRVMNRADILNAFEKKSQTEDSRGDDEFVSISHLL